MKVEGLKAEIEVLGYPERFGIRNANHLKGGDSWECFKAFTTSYEVVVEREGW